MRWMGVAGGCRFEDRVNWHPIVSKQVHQWSNFRGARNFSFLLVRFQGIPIRWLSVHEQQRGVKVRWWFLHSDFLTKGEQSLFLDIALQKIVINSP
jgi:hypothetical protein